jgi:Rrf2 family transcriptional regulator, iron-sulfur cluster assembly transcription factor
MILTSKGRFAVMSMVDIALYSKGKPVKLSDVSTRQEIDFGFLEQIFSKLKSANLVISSKGPGGGYQIARDTNEIFVKDILDAVEFDIHLTRCYGSKEGCMHNKSRCVTHHLWQNVEDMLSNTLSSISLADVIKSNKSHSMGV